MVDEARAVAIRENRQGGLICEYGVIRLIVADGPSADGTAHAANASNAPTFRAGCTDTHAGMSASATTAVVAVTLVVLHVEQTRSLGQDRHARFCLGNVLTEPVVLEAPGRGGEKRRAFHVFVNEQAPA